jgi:hypothetical protein
MKENKALHKFVLIAFLLMEMQNKSKKRMKQFLILLMSWLLFQSVEAQTLPKQNLFSGLDYSKHCSSGMSEFDFSREYYKLSIKRTEYCINATSTIKGDAAMVIVIHTDGRAKVAGTLTRYQNFIILDGSNYRIDQNSETLCFEFLLNEKQTTFSDGHSVDLCSDIITSKKMILGVKAGFQTDINAEAILHITLFAGRKFFKPF